MSTFIKLFAVLIMINTFMYVGINFARSVDGGDHLNEDLNFHWEGDLYDTLLANRSTEFRNMTSNIRDNWTEFSPEFTQGIREEVEQQGGRDVGNTGGISFLDSLKIIWSIIPTFYNIAASPLILFFNYRIPTIVGIIIGIPYLLIIVLTIFAYIRGVSD